jgi:hypothetical protein
MQNPKKILRGIESILNSSKELFSREDVTKVRLQTLVMNDELM